MGWENMILSSMVMLWTGFSKLRKTQTLRPIEMNIGETIKFELRNGEVRTVMLLIWKNMSAPKKIFMNP